MLFQGLPTGRGDIVYILQWSKLQKKRLKVPK
jgi:hypothetical protein